MKYGLKTSAFKGMSASVRTCVAVCMCLCAKKALNIFPTILPHLFFDFPYSFGAQFYLLFVENFNDFQTIPLRACSKKKIIIKNTKSNCYKFFRIFSKKIVQKLATDNKNNLNTLQQQCACIQNGRQRSST